jgi:hypothetical protein
VLTCGLVDIPLNAQCHPIFLQSNLQQQAAGSYFEKRSCSEQYLLLQQQLKKSKENGKGHVGMFLR